MRDAWLWWLLAFTAACCTVIGVFGWWEHKYHPERFEYKVDDDHDYDYDCCGGGVHEEWR